MLISGIILTLTFIGIFTEAVRGFHRTKFAMGGAGLMILVGEYMGFYNTELAVEAVDWNVVFLLGGMMTIVGIMIPTGGFQFLMAPVFFWPAFAPVAEKRELNHVRAWDGRHQ